MSISMGSPLRRLPSMAEPRCTANGKPCGTDTVVPGQSCVDHRNGHQCAKVSFVARNIARLVSR